MTMPLLEVESVDVVEPRDVSFRPHSVESDVRRELLSESGLSFASLVVRRIPNGVCLEGVLTRVSPDDEVTAAARRVPGVQNVQNHLLVCSEED